MVDAEELAKCFDFDQLRGYSPIKGFNREERRVIAAALRELNASPSPNSGEVRDRWPEIDTELSAYVAKVRADLIEECAKIAEQEPATHNERCIADPRAVRSNVADRIRAALSPSRGGEAWQCNNCKTRFDVYGDIGRPACPYCKAGGQYTYIVRPPCKGMNCDCTNGQDHSVECQAEHAANIAASGFDPRLTSASRIAFDKCSIAFPRPFQRG
ncbi:hypothetical protein, partial [Sphingomonas sp.]|uniref:hypothetical protein n=1 Tax=Sphingomonas sp. TaxID=28214 RepID=UPI0025ECE67D